MVRYQGIHSFFREVPLLGQHLDRIKYEQSTHPLTSFAGLAFLAEVADHLGVGKLINDIPGLSERHRHYTPADYALSLILTLAAGGDTLDEVNLLRQDPGLTRIFGGPLAAPNSVGEFLRRFDRSAVYQLSLVSSFLARHVIERQQLKEVTLDFDATLIESKKEEARVMYNGQRGYDPLLAWIAEANVWLTGVFRPGNASPQSHLLPLLKRCERLLAEGTRLRVRSHSAAYQIKILRHCHQKGHLFTITADLDAAVMDVIHHIPEKAWKIVEEGKEVYALAETVHAPGDNNGADLPAFRLIVKRTLSGQLELFKSPLRHHAVITNAPADWSAGKVLDFHNKRGVMEKAIGTLKNETGLDQLPCGTLLANAAYFQMTLLTYNLLQLFKIVSLPLDWRNFGWKKIRYRLIGQAALVVKHARDTIVKLARDYVYFPIFQQARWAVLGLAALSP